MFLDWHESSLLMLKLPDGPMMVVLRSKCLHVRQLRFVSTTRRTFSEISMDQNVSEIGVAFIGHKWGLWEDFSQSLVELEDVEIL